jgi:hypothetical protein
MDRAFRNSDEMHYEIRVQGVLDEGWAAWFDGLPITNEPNGMTVIAGAVTDQTALHGLLSKIRDLGLPLVSVRRLDPDRVSQCRCGERERDVSP